VIEINVSDLVLAPEVQSRTQIDLAVIEQYAEAMASGGTFPPIVVFSDGTMHWVADGFHRTHAAIKAALLSILADVRQGTMRDAVLWSVGANATHGLRRRNADKRRSVLTLLRDEEWSQWSDREIARRAGVGNVFVSAMRKELSVHGEQMPPPARLVTRGGTTYPMALPAAPSAPNAPHLSTETEGEVNGRFICNECGEEYDREVWHCVVCDHHWLEQDTRCKNCYTDRFPIVSDPIPEDDGLSFEPVSTVAAPKPHVANNSGNNEWYTPAEYIEAARRVLGTIDLDPASSDVANEVVKATHIYTDKDNGLSQDWSGNIWMNPPYASDLIGKFCDKLDASIGQVTQAIVLVNNATETAWFSTLIELASAVVFPRGRVKFWKPDGTAGAPLQGQAVIYIGEFPGSFMDEFSVFGWGAIL